MYLLGLNILEAARFEFNLLQGNTAAAISLLTSVFQNLPGDSNRLLMISLSRHSQRIIAIPTCTGVRPQTPVLGRCVHVGAIPPGIDKLNASEGIAYYICRLYHRITACQSRKAQ